MFDTIVVGCGAMGSATVYQLAIRSKTVLGLDQFNPPHIYGSSHGDTRICRQAVGEGPEYTPFSIQSYKIWREIETESNTKLLVKTGGLFICRKADDDDDRVEFLENMIKAAKKYGLKHEILDANAIRKRYPQFAVTDQDIGYFEPEAGFLRPEKCIHTNLELAKKYGAQIKNNEKVISYYEKNGFVYVRTDIEEYCARKLVLCTGSWSSSLIDQKYGQLLKVHRSIMYWFNIKTDFTDYSPPNFPVFIWKFGNCSSRDVYGFPAIDGPNGGVKIGRNSDPEPVTPETLKRQVDNLEKLRMFTDNVKPCFPGLDEYCLKAMSCSITYTPDEHFIIDFLPGYEHVILASPCSGHGFKHSAAVGQVLAELTIDGKTTLDITPFKINRFFQ